ncbi:ferredoxin--NADP reductase [Thiorhodococcus mannitoliphagus]|uniref:ferredoxin--NADP(+) reductase n=1 Tax=Thiorhodococcus mannitoliphagus TaxID=329406 RepID=A0A6P1DVP0_9GAMM|nr:ferredoxin--NADP reductase [Thiorhodococcus mannitoliphagus]NEX20152.1 ferredoxin--NADP reductase [Thiorhodococcus mannitoliphagus]
MKDWVKAKVIGKHQWAEGLYSLQFDAPIADFTAGQYIKVGLDIEGERVGRPYSLVNPPQQRPLEIYFNEIPEGPLTPPLSALNPGDEVWLTGTASGIFTLETVQPAETLWMLATGTGLGVYLSILRTPAPWERFKRVILVHGVRVSTDLAYAETLNELASQHGDRFTYLPAISRETHSGTLHGRITDLLNDGQLEDRADATITPETSHVMLCGNSAMIKEAKGILEARGLTRHRRQEPGHYTTEGYH